MLSTHWQLNNAKVHDLFLLGQAWDAVFGFLSAYPFTLQWWMLAHPFFGWLGWSLPGDSQDWVIFPASYTSSPCVSSAGSQILGSSHTVSLNLRSFPVGFVCHLLVELDSSYYFWKTSHLSWPDQTTPIKEGSAGSLTAVSPEHDQYSWGEWLFHFKAQQN